MPLTCQHREPACFRDPAAPALLTVKPQSVVARLTEEKTSVSGRALRLDKINMLGRA